MGQDRLEKYLRCGTNVGNVSNRFERGVVGKGKTDFLIQKENHVIPVECKAGNHVKAKSMMVYMEKYAPAYAIRISARNFGMVQGIKSVPLYSVFCI